MDPKGLVTLYLMTQKGFAVLQEIVGHDLHALVAEVIIGKDKNVSHDFSDEIEELCKQNDIVYHYRKSALVISSTYAIAISWRWLIPTDTINLIVLHDSLLPKYRGFAPLVNQLINREHYIGVTALFASENYDEGDIIAQKKVPVTYPIKIQSAIETIAPLYGSIVCELLEKMNSTQLITATKQDNNEATYSLWRDEKDYWIDWKKSADYIQRLVDAVGFPYKGAHSWMDEQKIIIEKANSIEDVRIENRDVGKVIFLRDKKPVVVCGTGLLQIEEAHYLENKESIFPLKKFRIRYY